MTNPVLHIDATNYKLIDPFEGGVRNLVNSVPEYSSVSDTNAWYDRGGANEPYQISGTGGAVKGSASTANQVAGIAVGTAVKNYYFKLDLASNDICKLFFRKQSANLDDNVSGSNCLSIYIKNNADTSLDTRFILRNDGALVSGGAYATLDASIDPTEPQGVYIKDTGDTIDVQVSGFMTSYALSLVSGDSTTYATNEDIGINLLHTGSVVISDLRAW